LKHSNPSLIEVPYNVFIPLLLGNHTLFHVSIIQYPDFLVLFVTCRSDRAKANETLVSPIRLSALLVQPQTGMFPSGGFYDNTQFTHHDPIRRRKHR
jgi:hypothetical protein